MILTEQQSISDTNRQRLWFPLNIRPCQFTASPDGSISSGKSLLEIQNFYPRYRTRRVEPSGARHWTPRKQKAITNPVALQFGKDLPLLESRSEILQMAGVTVTNTVTSTRCIEEALTGRFEIVMLCHSLSIEERHFIAMLIHRQLPSALIVLISLGQEIDPEMDVILDCAPSKLIDGIRELLLHPPAAH